MKLSSDMKYLLTIVLAALFTTTLVISCDEVNSEAALKVLVPANIDANGGTWTGVFMASPSQITIPAPAAETSTAYLGELQSIKDLQANLTDAQKKIIEYWS